MKKLIVIAMAAALALPALVSTPRPAAAQDPVGALLGGILGAGVGTVIGGRRGIIPGAIIGALIGSTIAVGQAGYFMGSDGRCYYQYPDGQAVRVPRGNCM